MFFILNKYSLTNRKDSNMNSRTRFSMKIFLAAFAMLFAMMGIQKATAQGPDGYCRIWPPPDDRNWSYSYCYSQYYGYITEFEIVDKSNGQTVFSRTSGDDYCYYFGGDVIQLKIGRSYTVNLKGYIYYGMYSYQANFRFFVDWNANASWKDANEYIGYQSTTGSQQVRSASFDFTVSCSVEPGFTRARALFGYYYYNPNSNDACNFGYRYEYDPYYYYYVYGEGEDYIFEFLPDIDSQFPAMNDVLAINTDYDGSSTSRPKPFTAMGAPQPAGAVLNFKITGPKPSTDMVYEGLDPITNSPNINMGGYQKYIMQNARGPFSRTGGVFNGDKGGEYRVAISVSGAGCPGESYASFTVSWPNDMAAADVQSPRSNAAPSYYKYPSNIPIAVQGVFQNVGVNPVSEFWAYAYIVNEAGDTLFAFDYHWDANNGDYIVYAPDKVLINFANVRIREIGKYKVLLHVDLLSAVDQEAYNDDLPRQGEPAYTFEISHDIQLVAHEIRLPKQGQVLIGNRPIIPEGMFKNVGIYDASDVPGRLNVYKLPSRQLVYSDLINVQDIPAGRYNSKIEQFTVMTLRETGTYEAELIISAPEDPVRNDDTTRITFYVEGGLIGTYTVGNGGNFPTIDSLMNALYYRGLAGSCTFLLTDSYYRVEGKNQNNPAWEFSTHIINLGWDEENQRYNTITFKPSQSKSLTKGSVTIDLVAPNGMGVYFGQSMNPSNENSIYYQYSYYGAIARRYVNFPGYVTFDGGSQKSLKFNIISNSRGSALAFYLGRGTENVTIKNVLIQNGTPSYACATWLPMTTYNQTDGFRFQPDTLLQGSTVTGYSAGVVNRSTLFGTEMAQIMRVDTIPNTNNIIQGNEISGFAYGVVSLGIGQLLLENEGDFARFYNKNNVIKDNIIYDICRAGIYLGYEEGTTVEGNRIYYVKNNSLATAGIIAGGDGTTNYKGYNNVKLSILGNEISGVESGVGAWGIKVEQAQNIYQHPSLGQVFFPDIAEESKIANNSIWGLTTTTQQALRAGIHVYTERQNDLWTPKSGVYHTRQDQIINNTVVLGGNGSISSTGPVVGIGLQSVKGAQVMNNAVALTDMGVHSTSLAYTGLFYQGVMPADGGLTSDYNAFYVAPGSNGSIARFVEADAQGINIEYGDRYDYSTLTQWQNWTSQDINSIEGNFLNDMELIGTTPREKLRVKTNPTPLGSILNNRGAKISWVKHDIDGEARGSAGQKYDIGHDEFTGRLFLSDVEALYITRPAAYRSGTGFFSDAEYVMTTAPVEVEGLIRNSGNLPQNAIACTLFVYREQPNGLFSTVPELVAYNTVSAQSGESVLVAFNLADGQAPDFTPKTYGELREAGEPYVPADEFMTMMANVTPKYRLVIGIQADQHNQNNFMEKTVRFYIRKSDMRIVASVENSMAMLDQNSTMNQIAGRLNADSLFKAFANLDWKIDQSKSRFDYDIFDRLGWEEKAVDYTMYRTMWWSDGSDKPLSRYQRFDIYDFLNEGNQIEKRNLIISSQEMVREHSMNNMYNDAYFTGGILRSENKAPGNPKGVNGNNDGNRVIGVALHRNIGEDIASTGYTGDDYPKTALVAVSPTGEGLAAGTQYYVDHSSAPNDSLAGVATTTLNRNVVYMGVDWRHWKSARYIVRAAIDFIEKNGGTIIPVELTEFDARAIGRRVELNWQTASEYNSDKFEIERTLKSEAGMGLFTKIDEVPAAGRSAEPRTYGPVVDRNVVMGETYIYRLKMLDLTGEFEYSENREVKVGSEDGAWLGEAIPNPVATESDMEFTANGNVTVELYDLTGKLIKVLFTGNVNGARLLTINSSDLTSGKYNVVLKTAEITLTRSINVVK